MNNSDLNLATAGKPATKSRPRTFKDKWRLTSLPNKIMVLATVCIAIASIVNLFVAAAQWKVISGQLREMKASSADTHALAEAANAQTLNTRDLVERTSRNAAATESVASASAAQVDASIRSSQLNERAWIGMELINGNADVGKPMTITVAFKNTGRTPAKLTSARAIVEPTDSKTKPEFVLPNDLVVHGGLVPPNGSYHVVLTPTLSRSTGKPGPLTQPMLDDLLAGRLKIFVHGQVDYADIFRKNHWMTFCYYLIPDDKTWGACTEHNETGDYSN